jgi:hypothetical protein
VRSGAACAPACPPPCAKPRARALLHCMAAAPRPARHCAACSGRGRGAVNGAGAQLEAQGVAIGYDGRHHSREFAHIAAGVVAAAGYRVRLFSDMVPTPLVAAAVKFLGCAAGVMVTASHNTKEYNGYKVWAVGGRGGGGGGAQGERWERAACRCSAGCTTCTARRSHGRVAAADRRPSRPPRQPSAVGSPQPPPPSTGPTPLGRRCTGATAARSSPPTTRALLPPSRRTCPSGRWPPSWRSPGCWRTPLSRWPARSTQRSSSAASAGSATRPRRRWCTRRCTASAAPPSGAPLPPLACPRRTWCRSRSTQTPSSPLSSSPTPRRARAPGRWPSRRVGAGPG